MAKQRKKKVSKPIDTEQKILFKDPDLEEIIEEVIEFVCPVRGKVKQKVKIKRFKYKPVDIKQQRVNIIDQAEEIGGDGLSMYSGEDE